MNSPANPNKVYVENYDKIIRRVFPCYDQILSLITQNIPKDAQDVLVFGCGTGNEISAISHLELDAIHGVDSSSLMIEEASKKTKHLRNVTLYLNEDFIANNKRNYSVVISTLVSHFLKTKEEKKAYLKTLKSHSKTTGLSILTDTFITGQCEIDEKTYKQWQEHLFTIHPKDRIEKDFITLRESTFPISTTEFDDLTKQVGYTTCHQIFDFFGLKTFLLS